ncbi:GntR family transcriptional regulator [Kitasatospora sp. NBC_00374]|uniref:GntR family transcriptional regulator n=1 Tax=Kitasatospora sp. NBC_00374 TaxID=2975964 RepID=UPI003244192E
MPSGSGEKQPKYRRIADALRAAVDSGQYRAGDRLPGENDLMETYGVARMTARQALGVLQTEGIAEARKGAGVFVRDFRPLRRHGVQRLAQQRWGSGRSIWSADLGDRSLEVDQVAVAQEGAPEQVAGVLGVEPGDPVCVRRRRFVLDGRPVLLSTSYLSAALVEGTAVTREDSGPVGTYARLAEIGAEPVRFREEIRSRMPDEDELSRLELTAGTPVILVCRTAFAADGRAVEVNEMVLDAASYVLEYDFDA